MNFQVICQFSPVTDHHSDMYSFTASLTRLDPGIDPSKIKIQRYHGSAAHPNPEHRTRWNYWASTGITNTHNRCCNAIGWHWTAKDYIFFFFWKAHIQMGQTQPKQQQLPQQFKPVIHRVTSHYVHDDDNNTSGLRKSACRSCTAWKKSSRWDYTYMVHQINCS